jgi:hypothetical protein
MPASCVITMQERFSGSTVSEGHFQKESGLEENRELRHPH